jgi:hypothetical protein
MVTANADQSNVHSERKLDFKFIPVPYAILARQDLEWIDKVIVGRILSFGDKPCFLAQETLAKQFGVSRRCINRRLAHLEAAGVIRTRRTRYSKVYEVICDLSQTGPDEEFQMSAKPDISESQMRRSDHISDPQMRHGDHISDSQMRHGDHIRCDTGISQVDTLSRNESSSKEVSSPLREAEAKNDDDSLLSSKPKSQNPQTQNPPDKQIIDALLWARAATSRDTVSFQLGQKLDVDTTGIRRIDSSGARQIYSNFQAPEEFTAYLADAAKRGLGQRTNTPGWGLWLKDAKDRAPEIRAEMARAAAAAQAKWVAQQRARLLAMPRRWKPCEHCHDKGFVGSALDKTLAFCVVCGIGGRMELQHGPDFPEQEIQRVRATPSLLLVAAAQDLGKDCTALALAECTISDDGANIWISAADDENLTKLQVVIRLSDVEAVLTRAEMKRKIHLLEGGPHKQTA